MCVLVADSFAGILKGGKKKEFACKNRYWTRKRVEGRDSRSQREGAIEEFRVQAIPCIEERNKEGNHNDADQLEVIFFEYNLDLRSHLVTFSEITLSC